MILMSKYKGKLSGKKGQKIRAGFFFHEGFPNNQNFIFNAMQQNEEINHFTMIFSNYALTTMILAAMVHDFVVPVVWQLGVRAGMLTL